MEEVEHCGDDPETEDYYEGYNFVTTDFVTNKLLMHAYMNEEALKLTITKREAYYYSRTRKCLWHKGSTSGFVQKVEQILIDDDQDCIWLKVNVDGNASCHVGYNSCFYREIKLKPQQALNLPQ